MISLEDVKKLAEMSRIDIEESRLAEIANDFSAILAYVGQIQEASDLAFDARDMNLINVMRDDVVTNEAGFYSDKIIAEMPDTENGFLKVPQIL